MPPTNMDFYWSEFYLKGVLLNYYMALHYNTITCVFKFTEKFQQILEYFASPVKKKQK